MITMITNCEVVNVGPNAVDGCVMILLKQRDGDPFKERWFVAAETGRKEMLATALAAISASKIVNVELESTVEGSRVTTLYMTRYPL
jgi:hypothetical protein